LELGGHGNLSGWVVGRQPERFSGCFQVRVGWVETQHFREFVGFATQPTQLLFRLLEKQPENITTGFQAAFGPPSNPVHGLKQFFVLHPNIQRQALARFGEYIQHFGAALRAFGGVHQDNHGEVVVHQLLADIENADLVFGQELGNVVNDADAVFADNGEDGVFRHGGFL